MLIDGISPSANRIVISFAHALNQLFGADQFRLSVSRQIWRPGSAGLRCCLVGIDCVELVSTVALVSQFETGDDLKF